MPVVDKSIPDVQSGDLSDLDQAAMERVKRRVQAESASSPRFALIAGISALLLIGMLFGASLWVLAGIAAGIMVAANSFLAKVWSTSPIAIAAEVMSKLKSVLPCLSSLKLTNRSRVPVMWLLVEDLLPKWATFFNPPDAAGRG